MHDIVPSSLGLVRDQDGRYHLLRPALTEDDILAAAAEIADRRFARGQPIGSVGETKRLFRERLATRRREVFAVLFLDNRHRVLACETLFYGTIDGAAADRRITERLQDALALIEVRVLDHLVVGDGEPLSFAEHGLL